MNMTHSISQGELLQELETTLDTLIEKEREEQEAILNRQSEKLPDICEKIGELGVKLQTLQRAIGLESNPKLLSGTCKSKLGLLQEITLQNHLLLDNSLHFLQEIFESVMGFQRSPVAYSYRGVSQATISGNGILMNMKM